MRETLNAKERELVRNAAKIFKDQMKVRSKKGVDLPWNVYFKRLMRISKSGKL